MSPRLEKPDTVSETYHRLLRAKERELLEFVLPAESPGYHEYRKYIAGMVVLAEGRRGKGNFVLGKIGDRADITSPLGSVVAYGGIETTLDLFTITVREFIDDQIDVEIVSSRGEEIPDHFEEKRRWTYSTWKPGMPSPVLQAFVREVRINETLVLAIVPSEKRLWLFDGTMMMNLLIPITNFYNELMLYKNIRDPRIALKSGLLFDDVDRYTEADLRFAFVAYNKIRRKVDVKVEDVTAEKKSVKSFFRRLVTNR